MRKIYNKIKFAIAAFFAVFSSKYLYGPFSRLWRSLFERKYTQMPQDLPWTPERLLEFFRECTWTSDPLDGMLDVISKPEKFYVTKSGDCDEYSCFACNVLDKKYKFMVSVIWWDPEGRPFRKFQGHNVCVYKVGNVWYHIGNWGPYGPYSSLMPLNDRIKTLYGPLFPAVVPKGCQPIAYGIRNGKTLHCLVAGKMTQLEPRK